MLHPPERLGVDNAVAVTLEIRANITLRLGVFASLRFRTPCGVRP